MTRVEEILSEMQCFDYEIAELALILRAKEVKGYVNYKDLIDEAFWLIFSRPFSVVKLLLITFWSLIISKY